MPCPNCRLLADAKRAMEARHAIVFKQARDRYESIERLVVSLKQEIAALRADKRNDTTALIRKRK
jgi:hypothetical protein